VRGKIEVGGRYDYSDYLTHHAFVDIPDPNVSPGTGSAIFISECILAGGIPMTVRPEADPTIPDCSSADLNDYAGGYQLNGWRVCPTDQAATNTWKNHQGILSYFFAPSVGLGGERLTSTITLDDIQYVVYQGLGTISPGNLAVELSQYTEARDALINKLNSAPLNTVQAGDYVYIDNPDNDADNHGFMVVGWGPLLGTQDAIAHANTNALSISRNPPTNIVPYVADFCFGTTEAPRPNSLDSANGDDRTGWLQDPRPRPFYSTHVNMKDNLTTDQMSLLKKIHYPTTATPPIPIYQQFDLNEWVFYKMPDQVTIPYNRIFYA
jgi:hypothetical protein